MRYFVVLGLNLLLLVSVTAKAQPGAVELIRQERVSDEKTVLYFSVFENPQFKVFSLDRPQRLVLDFSATEFIHPVIDLTDQQSVFSDIRSAKNKTHGLRIVFDMKPSMEIEKFAAYFRSDQKKILVVDVFVKQSKTFPSRDTRQLSKSSDVQQPVRDVEDETRSEDSINFLADWDISGYLGFENLFFFHEGISPKQHNNYVSGVFQALFYKEWDNGRQNFAFVPFYRYSQYDNRRTHFDIRELNWMMVENKWELRVGFRKVFWGVTEGLHLIDIINQTDLVENTDTEDKLGQPMINLALINDWGTLDLFLLTGFRERTFSGVEGRFRLNPEVAVHDAVFDKQGLEKNLAYAIRWSHYFGNWDIGISHFYGMGREPRFIRTVGTDGQVKIVPLYETINQTSLDLQMTQDSWLWKLEAMARSGMGKSFFAATGGLEYTFFDVYESGLDLGVVIEYMYDTRGAGNFFAPFQDDFLTALRFGFNDEQSTEILAGVLFDRASSSKVFNIEASRRIGDSWKIEAEMRLYTGAPLTDSLFIFRQDDHFRVEISYHF